MPRPKGKKNQVVETVKNEEVLSQVKKYTVKSLVEDVNNLQVEIQNDLGKLSGKLVEAAGNLEKVNQAIDLKNQDLMKLRQIEVTATTLDELEQEIKEKREAHQLQIEADNLEREREEEDYLYNRNLERKKEQDQYQLRKSELDRDLSARADAMKMQEEEIKALRAEKASFEETVKKAVSKAEAILTNVLKKDYEHQKALSDAQFNADKRLMEQQVSSMQNTIQDQKGIIEKLQSELSKAQENLKELATQTVSGAAFREAAGHMMRVQETAAAATGSGKPAKN